jgi:FKBP-type peptidyl-prolyl cis-trans isomerase (trigger factor)
MPRWPYTRGPHGLCVRHLGYAKRLRDTGIPTIEAEAQAEAAREFIMAELATRADLEVTRRELESSIGLLRRDMQSSAGILRRDLENSAGTLR